MYDETSYILITTNSSLVWLDEDTLQIDLNIIRFPENSQIEWILTGSFFNSSPVSQTFTTTIIDYTYPAVDTGQEDCYSDSAMIPCPSDVQSFYGQDAQYLKTARGLSTPAQHSTYTTNYTTSDSVTGLTWKTCSEGVDYDGSNCGAQQKETWNDAFEGCAVLNTDNGNNGYAGITSWRLPTLFELMTIVDSSRNTPPFNEVFFPDSPSDAFFWTSTGYADTAYADSMRMIQSTAIGSIAGTTKTVNGSIRCVSGP